MHRRDLLKSMAALPLADGSLVSAAACLDPEVRWAPVFSRLPAAMRGWLHDPAHEIQIVRTRIKHDREGRPAFETLCWNVDRRRWFAAASLVKLPMALLAAEIILATPGNAGFATVIALDGPPLSGEWNQDEPLREVFWRTLQRLFLVSDNVAFNRLYDFVGADAAAMRLQALGFSDARIISRLGSRDPLMNRSTIGSRLLVGIDGQDDGEHRLRGIAIRPATVANARRFPFGRALKGSGWAEAEGSIIAGTHDFSFGNFIPLEDLHGMLQRLVFPEAFAPASRWNLPREDALRLLEIMGQWPRDSARQTCLGDDGCSAYEEQAYPDAYAKYFVVGDRPGRAQDWFRSHGKTGQAYGYMSEVALLVDREAGCEVLLSAVVHANADGIFNDDRYEYDQVARPFLAALGRAVLDVERERAGNARPDILPERIKAYREA